MKKIILSFIFISIFFAYLISGQGIMINYPDKVQTGDEFNITLCLFDFEEGLYDIKIDILNENKRISRIKNGDVWRSTYYYINDAINNLETKDFLLIVNESLGMANLTIKLRDSKEKVYTFENYSIEFLENVEEGDILERVICQDSEEAGQEENENITEQNSEEDEQMDIEDPESKKDLAEKGERITSKSIMGEEKENNSNVNDNEVAAETEILLTDGKNIKIDEDNKKKNLYIKYGLVIFFILMIVLVIVKKRKNEFK